MGMTIRKNYRLIINKTCGLPAMRTSMGLTDDALTRTVSSLGPTAAGTGTRSLTVKSSYVPYAFICHATMVREVLGTSSITVSVASMMSPGRTLTRNDACKLPAKVTTTCVAAVVVAPLAPLTNPPFPIGTIITNALVALLPPDNNFNLSYYGVAIGITPPPPSTVSHGI